MRAITTQGFTLLELLITLVIASLALSLVGPRLAAVIPGVQLKAETNKVSAVLKHARSRAIAEGNVIGVYLDEGEEGRSLRQTGNNRSYRWPDDIHLKIEQTLAVRGAPEGIYFYPDGSSSGGNLTLRDGNLSYTVSVSWLSGGVSTDD